MLEVWTHGYDRGVYFEVGWINDESTVPGVQQKGRVMKLPHFDIYASDWLGSTRIAQMTPAEEGAYFHLLCHLWGDDTCSLPDDDKILASMSRLGTAWKKSGQVIRKCFYTVQIDGQPRLRNEKMDGVREDVLLRIEKNAKRTENATKARLAKAESQRRDDARNEQRDVDVTSDVTSDVTNHQPEPDPEPFNSSLPLGRALPQNGRFVGSLEAESFLAGEGIGNARDIVSDCCGRGLTPKEIAAYVEVYQKNRDRWDGVGVLCKRLKYAKHGQNPADLSLWPKPKPEFQQREKSQKRSKKNDWLQETINREVAKVAEENQALEAEFGARLDAFSEDELHEFCKAASVDVRLHDPRGPVARAVLLESLRDQK